MHQCPVKLPTVQNNCRIAEIPHDQLARDLPRHLTPKAPTSYTLELTANCNQTCIGCGSTLDRAQKVMRGTEWAILLSRLRCDAINLRISGGECTLHPDFAEIVSAVDSMGIPFALFTNAVWHRPGDTVRLLAKCKNLSGILVSLHGHNTATHYGFARATTFDTVTENIQRSVAAGIRVSTNTILLQSNVKHIADIIGLSLSIGVTSVAFSRYYGRPLPDLELSDAELITAIHLITELRRQEPRVVFNNCVPLCLTDTELPIKGCTSGFTHCAIDPQGNVRPCTHSPIVLGNIWDSDITEIWSSDLLREWRGFITDGCTSCAAFSRCRGGCRATAYLRGLTADPLMRQPKRSGNSSETQMLAIPQYAYLAPNYAIRLHRSGTYLVNPYAQVAVTEHARPILKMVEQRAEVSEMQRVFGQAALDFVGRLILEGLVVLFNEQHSLPKRQDMTEISDKQVSPNDTIDHNS